MEQKENMSNYFDFLSGSDWTALAAIGTMAAASFFVSYFSSFVYWVKT